MKAICTLTPAARTNLLLLFLFVFLTALAQPATATIRYVTTSGTGAGTSWSDASSDLQAMINASSNGDTVWVANGGYNSIGPSFEMKEGVKIFGGFTGTETSLSQRATITQYACALYGNSGSPVFSGWLSAASLLDGFTLNCIYNVNSAATYANCFIIANWSGGGMQNFQSSSPVLYNCQFRSNFDKGIAIYDNSVVTCHNCTFAYNYQCAIWMNGGSAFLYNCTFSYNQGQGGAIGFDGGGVYAENCTFNNNTGESGGAIYGYSGSITVFKCNFNNNMCPSDGGGAIGAQLAKTTVVNSTISGNTGRAGAIYSILSECYINNCLINGNVGAAYTIYTDHFLTSYFIINSTISGNFGGPAINGTAGLPTLYNTIVYNNTRGIEGGTATCYNSLVQGYNDIANGNISGATDPMFIDMQMTTDPDFPNTAGDF
ncbi:MAG TPA: right-handed parallel beta-helix repeat-containing protein, partial [Niastella sp.]